MTPKKPSVSAKKELRTTIKELRSKLGLADHTAQRLKSKAARLKKTITELEAQVKNLKKANKRLEKASRRAEPRKPEVAHEPFIVTEAPASARASAPPVPSPTVTSPTVSPDASWTVAQLRAEARSRGLTGLARKTKAELLAALGLLPPDGPSATRGQAVQRESGPAEMGGD